MAVKKTSQFPTHEKVLTPRVTSCTIPVASIQPGLDLSTQNASTYVAGYLLRKKVKVLEVNADNIEQRSRRAHPVLTGICEAGRNYENTNKTIIKS